MSIDRAANCRGSRVSVHSSHAAAVYYLSLKGVLEVLEESIRAVARILATQQRGRLLQDSLRQRIHREVVDRGK